MNDNKNNKWSIDLSQEKINLGKIMCILSIGMFLGGIGLDYFSAPQLMGEILQIRLIMSTILAASLALIAIAPNTFLKIYSYVISALFLSASVAILAMIYLTQVSDIAHGTYFAGLMIIIVTVFLGTYIDTKLSIFLSILIISAFVGMSYYLKTEFNLAANNTFFLGTGLLVGIISNAMKNNQLSQILLLQASLKESLREQNIDLKEQSRLARIDAITGIPNRRYGSELLSKMITNAASLDMIVVTYFLDLNGFKQINDTYGHDSGDQVLHIVASRVLNSSRKSDVFFRQGGDEFIYAIMIEKDNIDFAETFLKALSETIEPVMEIEGLRLGVSSSIGTAIYPRDGHSVEALIKFADSKMYEHKAEHKLGRNKPIPKLENTDEYHYHDKDVLPFSDFVKEK